MTPAKRRPATPANPQPTGVAKKDSTQQAPKDLPATQGLPRPPRPAPTDSTQQAPKDLPATQGLPRPPRPEPKDITQRAPIDTPAAQAPIDTPAAQAPIDTPVAKAPIDTPTSQVPARAAKKDSQSLGPDGEPVAEEVLAGDAGGGSAPPTETGDAAPVDRAPQSPGRSRALHPERVWPD